MIVYSFFTIGYYWHNPKNRKSFLNSFAKSREFDPLVAENWYNITKDSILNEKVASSLLVFLCVLLLFYLLSLQSGRSFLLYFRGSLLAALSDVYPRVRFDELMFERNFGICPPPSPPPSPLLSSI